jgi:hypothetical protein
MHDDFLFGPVSLQPDQKTSQVGNLCLTPCHFGFSPFVAPRRLCVIASEKEETTRAKKQ